MKLKYQLLFDQFYRITIPFYTVFLLYLMFFGFGRTPYDTNIVRLLPLFSTLHFLQETISWEIIAINILGNIFMFIPFGFLGIIFQKLKNLKTLLIHFLFAIILVESLQYFTRLGVFDVDDLILNTVGVVLGFIIYKKIIC